MVLDVLRNGIRRLTDTAGHGGEVASADTRDGTAGEPATIPASDTKAADDVGAFELLAEDFATYDHGLLEPGFWAVTAHRLGRRAAEVEAAPTRALLEAAYKLMFTGIDWVWGIHLPRTVDLGRRVRLWHNGCMLLTARAIGNDVHIRHDTTFGPLRGTAGTPQTLPVIEDRADLGSGVCVLGGVRVGHDAVVGANSVVLKNVPPHATVLGVPARIVPT